MIAIGSLNATHHGQCHTVYLVFILGVMLPEWTASHQELVQHATEGKPVRARIIWGVLREYLRRHVSVCAAVAE